MITATRLKIGEVAKETGVSVGTLRYYEGLKLLYPIERGDNGYRYYSVTTIRQVRFIKQAQGLGFSLEEIKKILDVRDNGELPCNLVQELLVRKIEQMEAQIEQITAFKGELERYRNQWAKLVTVNQEEEICPLIATVPLAT